MAKHSNNAPTNANPKAKASKAKASGAAYSGPAVTVLGMRPGSSTAIAAALYLTAQGATTQAVCDALSKAGKKPGPYLNLLKTVAAQGHKVLRGATTGPTGRPVTVYRIVLASKASKAKGGKPAAQAKPKAKAAKAQPVAPAAQPAPAATPTA